MAHCVEPTLDQVLQCLLLEGLKVSIPRELGFQSLDSVMLAWGWVDVDVDRHWLGPISFGAGVSSSVQSALGFPPVQTAHASVPVTMCHLTNLSILCLPMVSA